MLETECSTRGSDVKRGLELFRVKPLGTEGQPRGSCGGCGKAIWSQGGYRVPGVRGICCSMECIETVFGGAHCRWCGAAMSNSYRRDDTIKARLCSEDCRESYRAHVLGDRSAQLGSAKRLLLWLQYHQPETYRQLVGMGMRGEGYCRNPRCPNGEDGKPASLAHLRAGTRYCSAACKMQSQRTPNQQKQGPKTPVFIEDSSNAPDLVGQQA